MPEIIEVYKYTDFLKKNIHVITDVKIIKGRYTRTPFSQVNLLTQALPLSVVDIQTKGKLMYFIFADFFLLVTLGLTGGWLYQKNESSPPVHPLGESIQQSMISNRNIVFTCKGGAILSFYDQLSFGTMKIMQSHEELTKKLNELGPDVLHMTFAEFKNQILQSRNKKKEIANVLVDQKTVSGIGNYLRAG